MVPPLLTEPGLISLSTFHLPDFTLPTALNSVCTQSQLQNGETCEFSTWPLEVPTGPVWESEAEALPNFRVRFLLKSWACNALHALWYFYLLLSHFPPSLHLWSSCLSTLSSAGRKRVFLYGCWALTPLSLRGIASSYFSPRLCCLEGRLTPAKFLLPSPMHPHLSFLLCSNGISHPDGRTSTNTFYLWMYVQVNTLPLSPDCFKVGSRQGFWLLLVSELIGKCIWAKLLLVPWCMVQVPQFPQRYLC